MRPDIMQRLTPTPGNFEREAAASPFSPMLRSHTPTNFEAVGNAVRSGMEGLGVNLSPVTWDQYFQGSIPGGLTRARRAGESGRYGEAALETLAAASGATGPLGAASKGMLLAPFMAKRLEDVGRIAKGGRQSQDALRFAQSRNPADDAQRAEIARESGWSKWQSDAGGRTIETPKWYTPLESGLELNPDPMFVPRHGTPFSKVFQNDDLYIAEPRLRDVRTSIDYGANVESPSAAWMDDKSARRYFKQYFRNNPGENAGALQGGVRMELPHKSDMLHTAHHEVTHALSQIGEHIPQGTNRAVWADKFASALRSGMSPEDAYRSVGPYIAETPEVGLLARNYEAARAKPGQDPDEVRRLFDEYAMGVGTARYYQDPGEMIARQVETLYGSKLPKEDALLFGSAQVPPYSNAHYDDRGMKSVSHLVPQQYTSPLAEWPLRIMPGSAASARLPPLPRTAY